MTNGTIVGVSYIGAPKDNTAMFITKKVGHLLANLSQTEGCLVFAETGIDVPSTLLQKHEFRFSNAPQSEYALFTAEIERRRTKEESGRKYILSDGGYYVGECVTIGENAILEPLCFIGHDVVIGKNAHIMTGAKIKNAIIGDYFVAGENCAIGTFGFTMARDQEGNNTRIATLGKVLIGNHVEVGALTNISCSSSGNTILDDYAKVDTLVHIAHDVHIHKNTEIPSGAIIGGFSEIGEDVFVGINSTIRNRLSVGARAVVGMGAVVTKNVAAGTTVIGNPAKPFEKER